MPLDLGGGQRGAVHLQRRHEAAGRRCRRESSAHGEASEPVGRWGDVGVERDHWELRQFAATVHPEIAEDAEAMGRHGERAYELTGVRHTRSHTSKLELTRLCFVSTLLYAEERSGKMRLRIWANPKSAEPVEQV